MPDVYDSVKMLIDAAHLVGDEAAEVAAKKVTELVGDRGEVEGVASAWENASVCLHNSTLFFNRMKQELEEGNWEGLAHNNFEYYLDDIKEKANNNAEQTSSVGGVLLDAYTAIAQVYAQAMEQTSITASSVAGLISDISTSGSKKAAAIQGISEILQMYTKMVSDHLKDGVARTTAKREELDKIKPAIKKLERPTAEEPEYNPN